MEKQKTNPFRVPGDYFDTLPGRLNDRIASLEAERIPVRRFHRLRPVFAVAAAVGIVALLTFPLVRILTPDSVAEDNFVEISLLEGAGFFASDYEMAAYLEGSGASMGDDDAYINQAIEYLASTDVEMDLIFE